MILEKTNDNQLHITISSNIDSFGLEKALDYLRYLEATADSKAKQNDIDKLADEVNSEWFERYKSRIQN